MAAQGAESSCSFFLARLESEVERYRELSFPGHDVGPRKWLNYISGIIDTGRNSLLIASQNTHTLSTAKLHIQNAETLGNEAYQRLRHVAGSDATQIPHQIVAPFQRWAKALNITNTIFFRAEHLPNYELGWFTEPTVLPNAATNSLKDAISAMVWPVLRVTVPGQSMGMLPHFAVVGHELGHAIQDKVKPDFSLHQTAIDDLYTRVEARLKDHNKTLGTDEELRVQAITDAWVNELKADAIGHFLGGPAFFFALCGFLELAGQSYGIAPTHPPSDFRREQLLNQLNTGAGSLASIFNSKTGLAITATVNSPHVPSCPHPDKLFSEMSLRYGTVDSAICVELVPYLEEIAPSIFDAAHEFLDANCPKLIYTPEQLELDLDRHLDLLCALVPPIEFRDDKGKNHATGLASILNVGWAALLTRLEQIPATSGGTPDNVAGKMERLHELLLKGLELSEARRLWEEHQ